MDGDKEQLNEDGGVSDFSVRTWKDDLVLTVEDKQLYVCKQVLALMSPVFDAMFGGDFKEKNELELPEKKHDDICEFLRCIYPNILQCVTLKNVNQVLPLAEEYQVTRLKTECENCLVRSLSENTPAEELYSLLIKSYLYNLEILKDNAVSVLVGKSQAELDDFSTKVSVPADVEIDVQKRMIKVLKANLRQTAEKIKTVTALNECLAATATDNPIGKEYAKGNWAGDSATFEVHLKDGLKETMTLQVNDVKFTANFTKQSYQSFYMSLRGASDDGYDVRVMGMVKVNNWMKGKAEKHVFFNERMRTSSSHIQKVIGDFNELGNEQNGFIHRDGKISGGIHILVLNE